MTAPKRRWPRFSILGLFWLVTEVALILGWGKVVNWGQSHPIDSGEWLAIGLLLTMTTALWVWTGYRGSLRPRPPHN